MKDFKIQPKEENHSLRLAIKTMFTNSRTNYILKKLGLLDSFGYNNPIIKGGKGAEYFAQRLQNMNHAQQKEWAKLQLIANEYRQKLEQAECSAKGFFEFYGMNKEEKEQYMEEAKKYTNEIEYIENNFTNAEKTMHWKQGEIL